MQIRVLQRMGGGWGVQLPREMIRKWAARHVRHVLIEDLGDHLDLRPLNTEELMHYPRSEDEEGA